MRVAVAAGAAALLGGCVTTPEASCPPPRLERFVAILELAPEQFLVALGPARLSTEDVRCLAQAGRKSMQYELARRLEAGDGVSEDQARAAELYAAAATDASQYTHVYSPGFGDRPGQVMMIPTGGEMGLPQAKLALARMQIEGRAPVKNLRHAFRMVDRLAKQGFPPAIAYQAELRRRGV